MPFFWQVYHAVTQINLFIKGVLFENKLVIVCTVFVNTLSRANSNYFPCLVLCKMGYVFAMRALLTMCVSSSAKDLFCIAKVLPLAEPHS